VLWVNTCEERSSSDDSHIDSHMELDVLTVVVLRGGVFWYMTPCSPLKINDFFRTVLPSSESGTRLQAADRGMSFAIIGLWTLSIIQYSK
jgi:hypothetical protein